MGLLMKLLSLLRIDISSLDLSPFVEVRIISPRWVYLHICITVMIVFLGL